jgi:dihydrolipoamide dehydrogenase
MKKYDVIVVGSGSGMIIANEAVDHGYSVALVDRGPLGGTCLNVGCIPSKMLIFPADRIADIQHSEKLGIDAEVESIDFKSIMKRMKKSVSEPRKHMREAIHHREDMDYYKTEGYFTADYILNVSGQEIKGEKIFLASGSRPVIPPIKGIKDITYLTNETVLELDKVPESLVIIGGGYIGVEYGHFFATMGTKVTIIEMAEGLLMDEEPEICELLKKKLRQRMAVNTDMSAEEVRKNGGGVVVIARDKKTGRKKEFQAEVVMLAVGRRSNADLLKVENSGIKTDKDGFIKVNDLFETTKKNIYAIGDANGKQMFTHVANREASLVAHNAFHNSSLKIDYNTAPHAIYSHPQIASVGLTETQARKSHDVLVGKAKYLDTAKGEAMAEEEGFAKAIIDKETGHILGFHIIGPYAPILIQEVVNAMASGGHITEINQGIHIHPALSEIIPVTLNRAYEA